MRLSIDHFRAALFDFDETMIDLEPQHHGANAALCRAMGGDYAALPESIRLASGRRIIDEIHDMRAHFRWGASEEELFAMRHREFLALCRDAPLELMAGVERAVREIHAKGLLLAVTTSAVGDAVDEILRRVGLRDLFTLIVDGSEVREAKPAPEAYLLTARKLGLEPRDCIVFEDSQVGVLAAKRAGMFCVAVRNPRAQTRQDLDAADAIVDSFEEL